MYRRCLLPAVLALLAALCVRAQLPAFDVASLKPSPPAMGDLIRINLGAVRHGELTMANVSLSDILQFAFAITNAEQLAGPDWIRSKMIRFDIVAKAAPETPVEQIRLMLQRLATERFQLACHHEQRELSFLALEVGKKGLKIHEAREDAPAMTNQFNLGAIHTNRVTMQMLSTVLSRFLREPILDRTALPGYYEVDLKWTPEPGQTGAPATDDGGPSIYSAVQSQLGLALTKQKKPMDVLVVDRAERVPLEN